MHTTAHLRREWSSMQFALPIFKQRFNIVVIQALAVAHVNWLDFQGTTARWDFEAQRGPQKVVQRVTERCTSGAAFALNAFEHVLIQRHGRADAHDALMIASEASY